MRLSCLFLATCLIASAQVATESDRVLEVEAESFDRQNLTDLRKWVIGATGSHAESASGNAYVEVLPDTRATHDDKLIRGENFTNEPGVMAVLAYDVSITNPGRYFVWVRAYSTGTEDNGIHVGIDGSWPDSGQRMQWCEGKNVWTWASKQRTAEEHCGVPGLIWLDIEKPGRPHGNVLDARGRLRDGRLGLGERRQLHPWITLNGVRAEARKRRLPQIRACSQSRQGQASGAYPIPAPA